MQPTAPVLDRSAAVPVAPTRHEPTGRTFAFVQGADLFSATGVYVATVTAEQAAALLPPAPSASA